MQQIQQDRQRPYTEHGRDQDTAGNKLRTHVELDRVNRCRRSRRHRCEYDQHFLQQRVNREKQTDHVSEHRRSDQPNDTGGTQSLPLQGFGRYVGKLHPENQHDDRNRCLRHEINRLIVASWNHDIALLQQNRQHNRVVGRLLENRPNRRARATPAPRSEVDAEYPHDDRMKNHDLDRIRKPGLPVSKQNDRSPVVPAVHEGGGKHQGALLRFVVAKQASRKLGEHDQRSEQQQRDDDDVKQLQIKLGLVKRAKDKRRGQHVDRQRRNRLQIHSELALKNVARQKDQQDRQDHFEKNHGSYPLLP